mmetsp:Transcript_1539/g.4444  ORF Transcript_1539/g.4444 Transcript_1539/m.4444 type:complete len:342 (-) Transcript_1539:1187-2212(-)
MRACWRRSQGPSSHRKWRTFPWRRERRTFATKFSTPPSLRESSRSCPQTRTRSRESEEINNFITPACRRILSHPALDELHGLLLDKFDAAVVAVDHLVLHVLLEDELHLLHGDLHVDDPLEEVLDALLLPQLDLLVNVNAPEVRALRVALENALEHVPGLLVVTVLVVQKSGPGDDHGLLLGLKRLQAPIHELARDLLPLLGDVVLDTGKPDFRVIPELLAHGIQELLGQLVLCLLLEDGQESQVELLAVVVGQPPLEELHCGLLRRVPVLKLQVQVSDPNVVLLLLLPVVDDLEGPLCHFPGLIHLPQGQQESHVADPGVRVVRGRQHEPLVVRLRVRVR